MQGVGGGIESKWRFGESLSRPESLIALIVTCGFLVNVQQGTDTDVVLRSDPLVFKGIRILRMLVAEALAISTVVRRRIPYDVCLGGAMLPFVLYFVSCMFSIPFSAYPLLSVFKTSEIGLAILIGMIAIGSANGAPSGFFYPNVEILVLCTLS